MHGYVASRQTALILVQILLLLDSFDIILQRSTKQQRVKLLGVYSECRLFN